MVSLFGLIVKTTHSKNCYSNFFLTSIGTEKKSELLVISDYLDTQEY